MNRRLTHLVQKARYALVRALLRGAANESNMVAHCRLELRDWYSDTGPNQWMARDIEELLSLFSMQGHSGSSAPFAIAVFKALASFEPWSPLTGAPDEWSEPVDSDGMCQNRRCGHVFRRADGSAFDSEGRVFREPSGAAYTSKDSRVEVTFPYTPKREYVDVDANGKPVGVQA